MHVILGRAGAGEDVSQRLSSSSFSDLLHHRVDAVGMYYVFHKC